MANSRKLFIAGVMDKDSDDRLIQNGTLRHAENVEITNSEGSDEGTIQNPYSNKQLTSLDLGTNVFTRGKYEDEARNKILWHVKSDSGCYLLEWDNTSQSVSYVLKDTRVGSARVLNYSDVNLITGMDKVTNDNIEDDLYIWTDDNMEICCINIERAKKYGVNGFEIEDITLIKKPPRFAPETTLTYSGLQSNNIEEKFLLFAYRYQYLDNEWSALSSFTNYKFIPKPYEIDYYTLDNVGMVNNYNAVNVKFNVGDKRVKSVQIVYKESNSNVIYIIETFDKQKEGWITHNDFKDIVFSNNKNYRPLPSTELGRTMDNVPRKAKALALINNRLVVGNYLEGYNIAKADGSKIKLDYNVSLKGIPLNEYNTFLSANSNIAGNNTVTFSNSTDPAFMLELKKGYSITFNIVIIKSIPRLNTIVYDRSFNYILDKDFVTLQELFNYTAFISFTNVIINDFALNRNDRLTGTETLTTAPVLSIFTTGLNSVGFKVTPLVHTPLDSSFDGYQVLLFQSSTYASVLKASSSSSCKSNRDYEVGLEYIDSVSRETVVLTCPNNSIYIPNEKSEFKNTLSVEIKNEPPAFADRFKLVVKTPVLSYYTIVVNNFYNDGGFLWIKLEGSNIDKVKVGEYLILKSKQGVVQDTIVKTKVLEVGEKLKNFIDNTVDVEPAGFYMKIKPNGFTMKQDDNKNYTNSDSSSSLSPNFYPSVYLDLNTILNTVSGLNEKQKLYPGNEIKFKFLSWRNRSTGKSNKLYEQTYKIQRNYNNVQEWFNEVISGNSLSGMDGDVPFNYLGNVSVVVGNLPSSNNGSFVSISSGKEYLKVTGLEDGNGSDFNQKGGYLDATVEIRVSLGDYIFETEPKKDLEQNLFYKTEQTFEVIGGNHQGNIQNQSGTTTPCIIDLDFFNCFAQGNGVESYQVKDAFNKPFLNIDNRPTATMVDEYKEVRRQSDLTYAETYVESINRNGLNEFNLSRGNFKELDKSFGAITGLLSRNGDLTVFQNEKVSQVFYEKDEINSAGGDSSLVATETILGRQKPYLGENGCQNPESIAVLDQNVYYANVGNGVIHRLANDGVNTITKGMVGYFRKLFIERPTAKILGGIDPYFKKYALSVGDQPVIVYEVQCGNIISKYAMITPFTYKLKLNELSGDAVLGYTISSGNATIQANFNNVVSVVSNVTGSGTLTIPRTTLSLDTVTITVTPVAGSATYEITNTCPLGVPLKVVSIVLGDSADATKSITNQYKWGTTPYYDTLDTFSTNPLTRFTQETGVEGQGKFPLRANTVTIRSYSTEGQLGSFDTTKFNRLGYLISPNVYTSADVNTVLGLATFPTVTTSVENISNVVNSANFNFAKTTNTQILYLIWDYTNRNITLVNDAFTVTNAGTNITNVLSNDNALGTLTVTILTAPTNGTAVVNTDKTITYTHNGTVTASDSYVYQVSNGLSTATATVSITVSESSGITTPHIIVPIENTVMCYGQVDFRVNTTIPVKVNITGTFATGGSWLGDSFLTGTNKITANVVAQVITARTRYNFGIDGSQSGTYSNSSSITIELRDNTTNNLIDSYTYTRLHSGTSC